MHLLNEDHSSYLGSCVHGSAAISRAELFEGSVEEADCVVEIGRVDSEPFVLILALRHHDGVLEVTAAERRIDMTLQLESLFKEWKERTKGGEEVKSNLEEDIHRIGAER